MAAGQKYLTESDNAITSKYTKPSGGIPASDLADGVAMNVINYGGSYTNTEMDAANFCRITNINGILPYSAKLTADGDYVFSGYITGLNFFTNQLKNYFISIHYNIFDQEWIYEISEPATDSQIDALFTGGGGGDAS